MRLLVGFISLAFGVGLFLGFRPFCYLLVPEVALWHKLFGIKVSPLYRKTVGVLVTLLSLAVLTAKLWVSVLLRIVL